MSEKESSEKATSGCRRAFCREFAVNRYVLLSACVLQIALYGGVIYGWPSLSLMLRREGVYRELPAGCNALNGSTTANSTDIDLEYCETYQDLRLGQVYTAGSWAVLGSRFFIGLFLDHFGVRSSNVACAVTTAAGAFMLAFSNTHNFDAYLPGFFLVGFGGPGLLMSVQGVSVLFPTRRSTVLSILSGMFSASAFVFVALNSLHNAQYLSYETIFTIYGCITVAIALYSAFLFPPRSFVAQKAKEAVAPAEEKEMVKSAGSSSIGTSMEASRAQSIDTVERSRGKVLHAMTSISTAAAAAKVQKEVADKDLGSVNLEAGPTPMTRRGRPKRLAKRQPHNLSRPTMHVEEHHAEDITLLPFKKQIVHRLYLLATVFFCFLILTLQFFVGSIREQMQFKAELLFGQTPHNVSVSVIANVSAITNSYVTSCNLILAGTGLLTPAIGIIIDKIGFPIAFSIIAAFFALHNGINLITVLEAQYASFFALGFGRSFLYAGYFSFVGIMFGFRNFGKLAGTGLIVSATFSLIQYPLYSLSLGLANGDFQYVTYILLACSLAMQAVPISLRVLLRKKREAEEEAKTHQRSQTTSVCEPHDGVEVELAPIHEEVEPSSVIPQTGGDRGASERV